MTVDSTGTESYPGNIENRRTDDNDIVDIKVRLSTKKALRKLKANNDKASFDKTICEMIYILKVRRWIKDE